MAQTQGTGTPKSGKTGAVSFLNNSGRLPWFNQTGHVVEPYIIGIAGGSASGKTSVSQRIIKQLGVPWVVLLSMDSFYKSLTPEQIAAAHRNEHNFDHPDSFDYDLLFQVLNNLKRGIKVDVPVYDFATHSRLNKTTKIYGANVVIFEGIFALYDKAVRDVMDLKLFVDTDDDVRLARRIRRDIAERGRDKHGVLDQYRRFVKPSFDDYIYPTVKFADVIIPRGLDNVAAIDLITKHVSRQLNERGLVLRPALTQSDVDEKLSSNIKVLEQRPQLRALHTIIRDVNTNRHDFVFYAERLSRMVVERGLAELPFVDRDVLTPTGAIYKGTSLQELLCGVSIVRAGASMEQGLRKVVKDIPIGKVLIQTDPRTGEPQLHYCKLPHDIAKRYVIVVDAQIATGAAAMMAIRVILDHDVPQDHIIFLSLLSSPVGLHSISHAFPQVRIVTSAIDPEINDAYHIVPGFGNFGDRYFGTLDDE
ncbi:uridine kinase [Entophlyctis helioformis]|nr:uridine kinase [Entophlyctis helioformis]